MSSEPLKTQAADPGELEETVVTVVRWFIGTTDGSVAAVFRIALGLGALWAGAILKFNADRYYTEEGFLPWKFAKHFPEQPFSLIALAPTSAPFTHGLLWVFLAAALLLTLGLFSRVAALTIFLIDVALQHRNPYVINGGDNLLLVLCFLGSFLPLERRFSLKSLFQKTRLEEPSWLWSQRLIGLQICYIYLYAFVAKAKHGIWWKGQAMHEVLSSTMLARHPFELTVPVIGELACYCTLLFELSFPWFVWNSKLRWFYLLGGVFFHLGIELVLKLHLFSGLMLVSYIIFLKDEDIRTAERWVRRLLGRSNSPQLGPNDF